MKTLRRRVKNEVARLALRSPYDNALISVVERKYPKRGESLDSADQITVSWPDSPRERSDAAFGKQWHRYTFYITLISPNDAEAEQYVAEYAKIYDALLEAFNGPFDIPFLGVAGAWDRRARAAAFFDRGMLANNYNYQQVILEVIANS